MKKYTKSIAIVVLTFFSLQFLSSCFGKFSLVKKVYGFNDSIGGKDLGGRFVKTLLFWAMTIIPVYAISSFIDIFILNLIEFWTGSNPIAMKEGQSEVQFVTYNGRDFQMTATKGKLTIVEINSKKKNNETVLYFNNDNSICALNHGKMIKVADYQVETTNFASNNTGFLIASN